MIDPISKSLKKLCAYFSTQSIPYVIVGGVSVIVTGRTRMTMDIDIIIDHHQLDRQHFIDFLQNNGFDATLNDLLGLDEQSHCTFFLKEGMFRIDLKGIYSSEDKKSIDMAIDEIYNGIKVKISHPENTILWKAKFGSEQDIEDALAVFVRNRDRICIEQLRRRGQKMGIQDIIEDIINQVHSFLDKKKEDR